MFFGAHVKVSGGVDKAAERAAEMGAEAMQIFTQSPRMWRPSRQKPEAIERFRELRETHGIRAAVAHALYLINLASPNDEIYEKSAQALVNTVDACEEIGLDAAIFHVGSHQGAGCEAAVGRVAEALKRALDTTSNTWVLMENSAGAGGTIGRSLDELAMIFDEVGDHPRLGVCLDTCHWWVSGVDITDRETLDAQLDELDETIGLSRLRALHINDAQADKGSNRDRHANIGEGLLGERLGVFLAHPKLQGLPALLEVPGADKHGPDAEQVARVKALHARAMKSAAAHA